MPGDALPGGARWASGDAAGLSCDSWLESVVSGGKAAPDTALYSLFLLSKSVTCGTYRKSQIQLLFWLSGPLRGNFTWPLPAARGHPLCAASAWPAAPPVPRGKCTKIRNSTGKENAEAE